MPVLASAQPVAATIQNPYQQRVRVLCRALVITIAVCQVWTARYILDADGTAYADVARAWLRGDWTNALNSYWSPLYVWLLSGAFAVFRPSIHWELPLIHAVNLLGFFAAFAAWEWLMTEWGRWQGQPSHPVLIDIAGYYVISWSGLLASELGLNSSPDVFVIVMLITASAILVRVRRGDATKRHFVLLGIVLGAGFLAKTAFLAVIPIFLVVLVFLLRPPLNPGGFLRFVFEQRVLLTAFTTFALIAPFVAAISSAHHRFTMGDSGWINYSWHVTGMSVPGYKESAYSPGPEIRHPIRVLMQHPHAFSFEQHLLGTLPVHADPAWWCEGYPVRFDKARELMILWSNIRYSLDEFRCKALLLVLLCLPFGFREIARRLWQAWFMWVPAVSLILIYLPVFSEKRYIAGSYALIGFALLAGIWRTHLPLRNPVAAAAVAGVVVLMTASFRHWLPDLAAEITGKEPPVAYGNVEVAENMRRYGLQSGDRVAYIGFSLLGMTHVGLDQAHIVATVPEHHTHGDKTVGRPLEFTFPNSDEFWRSSPQVKHQVLDAFRSVGAKWAFANVVPQWADMTGWKAVGEQPGRFRLTDRPYVYFRRLE